MTTGKLLLYRICSIGHHGCYLVHYAILCSFYSRAATIRERRLLSSGRKMKNPPLPQGRWSGCRHQGDNPKRHYHCTWPDTVCICCMASISKWL